MRYHENAVIIAILACCLALFVEAKSSPKAKAYEQIHALHPNTAQSVCQIILFDTRPQTTSIETTTTTITKIDDVAAQSTTDVITITESITDQAPTTTVTSPVSTSTTYIATVLNPSSSPSSMKKRHHSKHDRDVAHYFLRKFDSRILRSICVDVLYQGHSTRASTKTVRETKTITVTQASTAAESVTTSTTTQTTHTVLPTVSVTASSSTVTTSATKTVYLSLPTDSTSYCTAQGQGCSCVVGAASNGNPSITCTYTYVGQPSYFIAPCSGNLAAQLQGGSGGQSYYYNPDGGNLKGSLLSSSAIGSSSSSSAIITFSTGSQFSIRVGGTGTDASAGTSAFGRGGYNGGGHGGCTGASGFVGHVCAGGGGGATDLSYNGQVILAAGGAGGGAEGASSRAPSSGHTDNVDPQPQGGSSNPPSSTGGGGGGGYPGGANGVYDQSSGYAGFSLLSTSDDQSTFPGTLSGPAAVLTFTCTAP